MKTKRIFIIAFSILFLSVFFGATLTAQNAALFKSTGQSKVYITGTSTLHDWHMQLKSFECTVSGEKTAQDSILLKNTTFTAKVSDLKSNESSIMDNKAYKALKSDKFPTLSFTAQEDSYLLTNNQFKGVIKGWLTIAGEKKPVTINISGTYDGKIISVEGEYPLSLSSYGIKPPTAFFGTLKTGDQIIIHFKIILQNS